jgi:hypothetical protein
MKLIYMSMGVLDLVQPPASYLDMAWPFDPTEHLSILMVLNNYSMYFYSVFLWGLSEPGRI